MTTTKTILVVDDDPDFLLQQRMQLEAAGFRVLSADGQAKAEALLADEKPDLAILDLMMENFDAGFVLSHRIKKLHPGTPVILVTAVTSETGIAFDSANQDERSWIKADAILAKPIRFEELQREIDRLLG
jgi:two-component system, OmpR family, response regulator